jgi:hypothetical protein
VAVFDDRYEAEQAVDELERSGFTHEDVGFALRGSDVVEGGTVTDAIGTKDDTGAAAGAMTGGVVGGLFGAAMAMVLPGIGPILAGGILATSIGYAAAGVAVGGILGAMMGAGITEEEAKFYEKEFRSGKAIVTVRPGDRADLAMNVLRRHGGYDVHTGRDPRPTA